ncbi:MAG: aminopeptidase P family protein [Lachnospiraceae bacterium]|nr:aminopeptidase P family protein [Lachnospiraceae bacterium]
MENKTIKSRLTKLRAAMEKEGVDFYLIPTDDYHGSEYVADHFKVREYFSNFTGDNATLVVSQQEAGLWTDGRFFIQAEDELKGTGVTLFRMGEEGVPTLPEYLVKNAKKGNTVAFDGRCMDAATGLGLEKLLTKKGVKICYEMDLGGQLWTDRPALPCHEIFVLSDDLVGKSLSAKVADVRKQIKKAGASAFLLSKLDDIMWLLNIRGLDIECNPVALSYLYLTMDEIVLFVQSKEVNKKTARYFKDNGVSLKEYDEILPYLNDLSVKGKIFLDRRCVNYALYKAASSKAELVEQNNPTELMKAIKNATELKHLKDVYIRDSAALTKFIYWVKKNVGKREITEMSAAAHLDHLREKLDGFIELSFPTISGYGANAAMMHYAATPDHDAKVKAKGMLLVDSGGTYFGGTTDVTRTIVVGEITEQMKEHFSKVAAGCLQLSNARFLYGCTGRNLDILAREPLWELGIDYKCGTGHGVGYILNVHEGPQNIRWRYTGNMVEAVLEEGMIVSDEPGVYIEGEYGIRTENIILVRKAEKNGDGQFMKFDQLTYAPIDREALDKKYLTEKDVERINAYHKEVYKKISPYLTIDEKEWLKDVTRPL